MLSASIVHGGTTLRVDRLRVGDYATAKSPQNKKKANKIATHRKRLITTSSLTVLNAKLDIKLVCCADAVENCLEAHSGKSTDDSDNVSGFHG